MYRFAVPLFLSAVSFALLRGPLAYGQALTPPAWQWSAGSSGRGLERAVAVGIDSAGFTYVAGWVEDSARIGPRVILAPGRSAGYVARVNRAGQWQRVTVLDSATISSLTTLADGTCFVTGELMGEHLTIGSSRLTAPNGGIFVARLSPQGTWDWAAVGALQPSSIISNRPLRVMADANGRAWVSGLFRGELVFGNMRLTSASGLHEAPFVARLSAGGQWRWARQGVLRGRGVGFMGGLALSPDGAAGYLSGEFQDTVQFGAHLAMASPTSVSGGSSYITAIDSSGTWQWARSMKGRLVNATAVATDARGEVYVGGHMILRANADTISFVGLPVATTASFVGHAFVLRLSASGQPRWVSVLASGGPVYVRSMATHPATDRLIIAGGFTDTLLTQGGPHGDVHLGGNGALDIFVAGLDSAGGWRWAQRAGGPEQDQAYATVCARDGIYVAGNFSISATFGAIPLTGSANGSFEYDAFLAKLAAFPPLTPSGRTEAPDADLRLYPNPAWGAVYLTLAAPPAAGTAAHLLDGVGRVVCSQLLPTPTARLDLRGLPAGVYTLRVGAAARRLVVE